MNAMELIPLVGRLLGHSDQAWNAANVVCRDLVPDGSSRRFFQLHGPERQQYVAVLPPENDKPGQDEALSFFLIGQHLQHKQAPVARIEAMDPETHLVLCEDLGQCRLFEQITQQGLERTMPYYEQTVRSLARMQVQAAEGFDPAWCWDTSYYDQRLMQERESGYFLRACCTGLLGLGFDRLAVEEDCRQLAMAAARAPARFFLHRDFQSRNIMIKEEQVRFIDFQGGRFGPLAYDLASLLLDPYVSLPETIQDHLRLVYLEALQSLIPYDAEQFQHEYVFLALQRNLQILGAFSFLSQVRQKSFFCQFISPALATLSALLARPEAAGYAHLRSLVNQCRQELKQRS